MDKLIVGKIVKLHGIKGAVKVDPVIDDNIDFAELGGVFIDFDGEFHKFEEVFAVSDMLGIKFEDVNSVEEAKSLVGKFVLVDKSVLESMIDDNSFFIEELKGSNVSFEDGESIGILDEIDNFGSADIFYVKSSRYKNLSMPHIEGLIVMFDEANRDLVISRKVFEEVAVYDD